MNDSKKRKRKTVKVPNNFLQNESLELITSPEGPIKNSTVTEEDKDILLQRLKIELLDKYQFSSKKSHGKLNIENEISILFRKCLIVGTNECSRALEKASTKKVKASEETNVTKLIPTLVILAMDIRPPTILAHIPCHCMQLGIPILLLPGRASMELGKILKIKQTSIMLLMSYDEQNFHDLGINERKLFTRINSYVDFVKTKLLATERNS